MQAEEKIPEKLTPREEPKAPALPPAVAFTPIVMGEGFVIKGGIYKVTATRTRGRINLKFVETFENAKKRKLRQQAGKGIGT